MCEREREKEHTYLVRVYRGGFCTSVFASTNIYLFPYIASLTFFFGASSTLSLFLSLSLLTQKTSTFCHPSRAHGPQTYRWWVYKHSNRLSTSNKPFSPLLAFLGKWKENIITPTPLLAPLPSPSNNPFTTVALPVVKGAKQL